ncbi:pyrroline-5-carboxylate reductase [Aquirhabdus sp.]|uniref:pyrroline-5-carboxylate reductase n=1 Tax=Aquirhabdus sp. TaxID=2824160 RepID=UPI00396CCF62
MSVQHNVTPIDSTKIVAFIGGGNMAQALIGGLLAEGLPATMIRVAEPVAELREILALRGVGAFSTATEAVKGADVVVLAVKPQIIQAVLAELADLVADKLVISIAAGISVATIAHGLAGQERIVRAMPNTPALVQTGATGLYADDVLSQLDRDTAATILSAAGLVLWVEDESLMHAVTAVSGSGPAYFFYLMEAMIDAGVAQGLDERTARALTLQTALGAAQMAIISEDSPAKLRQKVTSPNGTTAAAIDYLDAHAVRAHIIDALAAAETRSIELSAN